ncbi:MAG: phosphatidate cytidylyltransferase [Chloroflexi bacterium]|nr:phosphatidate cytidylyltransferase [Chloroflexota bacterium]
MAPSSLSGDAASRRGPRPALRDSLRLRVATAAVGTPLLLLLVVLGSFWLTALVVAAALLGLWEFYRLSRLERPWVLQLPGFVATALLVVNGHVWRFNPGAFVVATGVFFLAKYIAHARGHRGLDAGVSAILGPLYLGGTLAYAPLLRALDERGAWLLVAILGTFAVDTSAYFVGRAVGRHRMAPRVSPGKTWEGAAAGLLGGLGAVALLSRLLGLPISAAQGVLLGLGVGIVAQAGDLLESALKRAAGAKEAGRLVPGHGGLLDRLDSLVLSLVLMYYGATWLQA